MRSRLKLGNIALLLASSAFALLLCELIARLIRIALAVALFLWARGANMKRILAYPRAEPNDEPMMNASAP